VGEHESSINYKNLIQNHAEMYPYPVDEVVLVEIVANALDAKATRIAVSFDKERNSLIVEDNGDGMNERQFDEYHDFAAGLKTRGSGGIGFAGLGAKISFNIADRVLTETVSRDFAGASNWYLRRNKKLIWEDQEPHNLKGRGTRVEVKFKASKTPDYQDSDGILRVLHHHYLPLFDPGFLKFYGQMRVYDPSMQFIVNGKPVREVDLAEKFQLTHLKRVVVKSRQGKRYGLGLLGLANQDYPVGGDRAGVLLSTYGKNVKSDMFNQFPGEFGPRIFALFEVPGLIYFLTTSKSDFIKLGKHRQFNALYTPIGNEFKAWLKELGVKTLEFESDTESRSLERELKRIAEFIPEISDFFGFRDSRKVLSEDARGKVTASEEEGVEVTLPDGDGESYGTEGVLGPGDDPGTAIVERKDGGKRAKPISRKAKRGPKITFIDTPEKGEMSWVDGNYVCINKAHPAYKRSSSAGKTMRLHNMFAIGSAIQRYLAKEAETPDLEFIDRLMAAWGRK